MTASETHCRLYLIAEPTGLTTGLLAEALSGGDVACLLLSAAGLDRAAASELCKFAQLQGVAVVVDRDIDAAAAIGADGVHIDTDRDIFDNARDRLGDEAIIGIDCGRSRHDAMTFAELGASYVAFAPGNGQGEMVKWWAELFEVPCVAWDAPDQDTAAEIAFLGCEFVSLAPKHWSAAKDGVAKAISGWNRALSGKRTAA